MASADEQTDIDDNERARAIRLQRDLALTPAERIVELDQLLRSLAALQVPSSKKP